MAVIELVRQTAFAITSKSASGSKLVLRDDEEKQKLIFTLTAISLTIGSVSVVSTLATLYWFIKMKRTFRHELIMLLIQSDFVKSLAFVIFALVSMAQGGYVDTNSTFCQVSGFAVALGMESADMAVLLIALHCVMYILRPRSGLYPYRRAAYTAYYFFPFVMASLAFVDGDGYENLGHYCYLKTDESWERMALSWVPRYIISTSIVAIYAFVYLYVMRRMDDYGRRSSGSLPPPRSRDHQHRTYEVPPTPRIAYHGLLPSTPSASRRGSAVDAIPKSRQRSVSSVSTMRLDLDAVTEEESVDNKSVQPKQRILWNWSGFQQPSASIRPRPSSDEPTDPCSPTPPVPPAPPPIHPPNRRSEDITEEELDGSMSAASTQSFWRRPVVFDPQSPSSRRSTETDIQTIKPSLSVYHILSMLRKGPTRARNSRGETESSTILMTPGSFGDDSGVAKNREKIRRQLRLLFAYPLVYIIIWVFPFVSHVLGYDDEVTSGDPKWLLIVSIISLCVQGAVDCLLFTIREQPWKHARGTFWGALVKRFRWDGSWRDLGTAGRTREEMLVDGRLARQRRDEEVAVERALRNTIISGVDDRTRSKPGREWWDAVTDGPGEADYRDSDGTEEEEEDHHNRRSPNRDSGHGMV